MAPRKEQSDGENEENGSGYRISLTIDPSLRKQMRLAAALHDKSIGEWAAAVLEKAADKATEGVKLPTGGTL
jgi:predicted HicB family RNase H-like nuclease